MTNDSVSRDSRIYYIYALIDPRSETVYYIGQTVNLTGRVWAHKSCGLHAHKYSTPVYKATKEILKAKLEPIVVTLDSIETPHRDIVMRLEECWRIHMLNENEVLHNAWKTGRCIDTDNPMAEAAYIKGYALATVEQIEELRELDKVRALQKVFG